MHARAVADSDGLVGAAFQAACETKYDYIVLDYRHVTLYSAVALGYIECKTVPLCHCAAVPLCHLACANRYSPMRRRGRTRATGNDTVHGTYTVHGRLAVSPAYTVDSQCLLCTQ